MEYFNNYSKAVEYLCIYNHSIFTASNEYLQYTSYPNYEDSTVVSYKLDGKYYNLHNKPALFWIFKDCYCQFWFKDGKPANNDYGVHKITRSKDGRLMSVLWFYNDEMYSCKYDGEEYEIVWIALGHYILEPHSTYHAMVTNPLNNLNYNDYCNRGELMMSSALQPIMTKCSGQY